MKTKDLIAEISDLPVEQRARIADQILLSLNAPVCAGVNTLAWF